MTDEQLTEWCVGKVREWLATGHPSAWRAWGTVQQYPQRYPRLGIYALTPWAGHWSTLDLQGEPIGLLSLPVPFRFGSTRRLREANYAVEEIFDSCKKITARVSGEEWERILEEAAAIATNPTDWRTLGAVPEDYYAL